MQFFFLLLCMFFNSYHLYECVDTNNFENIYFFLLFQVHLLKFLWIFLLQILTTKEITMCIQNLSVLTAFIWLIYHLIIKNTFWFTWGNDLMAVTCVEKHSFVKIISNAMLLLVISNQISLLRLEFQQCILVTLKSKTFSSITQIWEK